MIQNQQIRNAFTRFRLGISQILTRKRRYTDENAVMLRCPLCNVETENEVHLLATCAWYDHIHQKYLSERFDLEVFQHNCMHALAALACFFFVLFVFVLFLFLFLFWVFFFFCFVFLQIGIDCYAFHINLSLLR